jgi:hypothetical protein
MSVSKTMAADRNTICFIVVIISATKIATQGTTSITKNGDFGNKKGCLMSSLWLFGKNQIKT